MMPAHLLRHLEKVRDHGFGRWSARCPAHADRLPSLSIREADSRILLHCFAGCKPEAIVEALGLEMRDLFTDTPTHPGQQPVLKPQRLDLVAVAFRFELAALDRRFRADAVLKAVAGFNGDNVSDEDRDRLMNAVACAYADRDRAAYLETVADDFRLKAFQKREDCHAA